MALIIEDRTFSSISIIDDEKDVRDSYEASIAELDVHPVRESGPLGDLETFARNARTRAQAALCDFKLRAKQYALFDGAQLVSRWFDMGFPAVLCTAWESAHVDELRHFRAKIPAVIRFQDLDADRIREALTVCVRELDGRTAPGRVVHRALVRVEEVEVAGVASAYVVVPGWNPQSVIRVLLSDVPPAARSRFLPGARLFARVNLGAECYEDLFFASWEGE